MGYSLLTTYNEFAAAVADVRAVIVTGDDAFASVAADASDGTDETPAVRFRNWIWGSSLIQAQLTKVSIGIYCRPAC